MSDCVKIFHSDDQIFLIILKTGHRQRTIIHLLKNIFPTAATGETGSHEIKSVKIWQPVCSLFKGGP